MPRFSAASYTSSAIPSATSHASSGVHSRSAPEVIYGAINVKQAVRNSRSSRPTGRFIQARSAYGKTISHVERGPSITMAVPCARSCNTGPMPSERQPSFRKVTKKALSPTRMQSSRFASTYASKSLKKWKGRHVANWAMVRNQAFAHGRQDVSAFGDNTMLLIESIYTKLDTLLVLAFASVVLSAFASRAVVIASAFWRPAYPTSSGSAPSTDPTSHSLHRQSVELRYRLLRRRRHWHHVFRDDVLTTSPRHRCSAAQPTAGWCPWRTGR